jgi:Flp pilus assembly protein TadG
MMKTPALRPPASSALMGGKDGVAAMEFGILAPVMVLLLIAVFNLAKIMILWEQVWSASRSIAESATTLALPTAPNAPSAITAQQANLALSSIFAQIPWVAAGIATGPSAGPGTLPANSVGAALTSVNYTAPGPNCTSNCTSYTATVVWSIVYVPTGGTRQAGAFRTAGLLRPCGDTLTPVGPGQASGPDTISTLNVGSLLVANAISVPDPFLIADVQLSFTPYLFSFITGPITLSATSYVPVRTATPGATAQYIQLNDAGQANAGPVCNTTSPVQG